MGTGTVDPPAALECPSDPKSAHPFASPPPRSIRTVSLVDILPCIFASKHIFNLLALHLLPLKIALVENELVRAGATLEAIFSAVDGIHTIVWNVVGYFGDGERVGACRAD